MEVLMAGSVRGILWAVFYPRLWHVNLEGPRLDERTPTEKFRTLEIVKTTLYFFLYSRSPSTLHKYANICEMALLIINSDAVSYDWCSQSSTKRIVPYAEPDPLVSLTQFRKL
jgi:hypothetical protein